MALIILISRKNLVFNVIIMFIIMVKWNLYDLVLEIHCLLKNEHWLLLLIMNVDN